MKKYSKKKTVLPHTKYFMARSKSQILQNKPNLKKSKKNEKKEDFKKKDFKIIFQNDLEFFVKKMIMTHFSLDFIKFYDKEMDSLKNKLEKNKLEITNLKKNKKEMKNEINKILSEIEKMKIKENKKKFKNTENFNNFENEIENKMSYSVKLFSNKKIKKMVKNLANEKFMRTPKKKENLVSRSYYSKRNLLKIQKSQKKSQNKKSFLQNKNSILLKEKFNFENNTNFIKNKKSFLQNKISILDKNKFYFENKNCDIENKKLFFDNKINFSNQIENLDEKYQGSLINVYDKDNLFKIGYGNDFKNIEDNFKETIIEENKLFLSFPQSDIKQLNEIKEEINTTEKKNKKEVIKNKILQKESLKTERKEISNENLKTEKKDNPKKEQNFKLENPKQIFNSEKPKEEFSKKSQKKENIKINGNSEKILKILKSDFQNFNKKFTIEIINIKKDFQNFKTTNKTEIKKIKTQIEKSKKQSPKNFLKEQKESLLISDLPSLKMGHIIYNKKDDKNIFEKENKNPNEEEKNNFINKANLVKSIDLNNSEENYKIENSVVSVILDENNFMRYKNMKFVLSDSGKKINLSSNKKKFLEQQNYEIF